jgi:uncharacterized membrane-anchored protein
MLMRYTVGVLSAFLFYFHMYTYPLQMHFSPKQQTAALHSIITLLLAVFFLYFVMIGNSCASLMQCRIQDYVNDSLIFKHTLLLVSIMVFSFVLGWYSEGSVFPQWDTSLLEKTDTNDEVLLPEHQLLGWVCASLLIYAFVILLNKCEWQYFGCVAVLLCVVLMLFTFLKMYTYKYQTRFDDEHKASVNRMQKFIIGLFAFLCVVVLCGVYAYYVRQYKDHSAHWNWVTFFFAACEPKRSS